MYASGLLAVLMDLHRLGVKIHLLNIGITHHNVSMQIIRTLHGVSTFPWQLVFTLLHVEHRLGQVEAWAARHGAMIFLRHLATTLHLVQSMGMKTQIGATVFPFLDEALYLHAQGLMAFPQVGATTYL